MHSQEQTERGRGEEAPGSLSAVILRNMAEGVCLVRADDGLIVYANPRFEQMFGYGPGELVGRSVSTLNAPLADRSPEQVAEALISELRTRGEVTADVHNVRKDGTCFWSRSRCSAFEHPRFGSVWVAVQEDITERKLTAERLRAEQRRLEALVDALPVGVWLVDGDGTIVLGNPAALRMWGGGPHVGVDEIGAHEAWHAESGQPLTPQEWAGTRAIERGETTVREVLRIRGFDGKERTILNSATPILSDSGERLGAVVVHEDVSELHETQARFAGIVTSATEAILTLDEARSITFLNGCAERVFGHLEQELLGMPVELLFAEASRPVLRAEVEALLRSGGEPRRAGPEGTLWARRSEGPPFPAEVFLSRYTASGHTFVVLSVRDVTERVRLQEAQHLLVEAGGVLASSLDLSHALRIVAEVAVGHLADYCAVDVVEEEHIQRMAVAAAAPANAGLAEALKKHAPDLSVPGLRTEVFRTRHPLVLPKVEPERLAPIAQNVDLVHLLALLPARSMMVVPLVARERTLGTLTLISTRKERVYGAHELYLAEQLAWRAALALDNVLLLAQARQATRAREELMSIVAHDLRSPLQAIQLQAISLLRKEEEGRAKEVRLHAIVRATERMDRLIEDLMDLGRIQGHTLTVRPEPLAPEALLADVREACEPQAHAHEFRLWVAPGLPPVRADRARLTQVFVNLVTNALKFTPPGGRIQLGAEPEGAGVRFFVRDSGPGILPEQLPHLFEPFWQADVTDRRGLGLGLTISKGLVDAHGSHLEVESVPGKGTTFSFTLPAAPPECPSPSPPRRGPG